MKIKDRCSRLKTYIGRLKILRGKELMGLRHFSESDIILSNNDAWQVLVFFFGGNAGLAPGDLNLQDREFAEALLFEAMEASDRMDFVVPLLDFAVKPQTAIVGFMRTLALKAVQFGWKRWKHSRTTENPQIYNSIKVTVAYNWRTIWQIRVQTGELSW
jgi:hypothetical protein